MKTYFEWLEELIKELNYDTLIEEPWSVSFFRQRQCISDNGELSKDFYYVHSLDRTLAEFPVIREQLEKSGNHLECFSYRSEMYRGNVSFRRI